MYYYERMISVVIPVHNEEGNVKEVCKELQAVLGALSEPFEIIFIDDGSTDETLSRLHELEGITILELSRNYGQAVALDAGFKHATGDLIVSIDGDGQNDPADIPALIAKLRNDQLDVVAGWRVARKDSHSIVFVTNAARMLRGLFIGDKVHDSGCTLRVYTRDAIKSLDIGGEMHRYILALLSWKGFRIGELPVAHRTRRSGVSKYRATKAVRGLIDLVYIWFIHKYSQRPLHLFGYMGFASFALGIGAGFWSIYGKLFLEVSLNRNGWFFIALFCTLAGILLFSLGVIIDLLLRIQLTASPFENRYRVRRVIEV